ncbi:MAG: serine hydrolase [Elusimicrobiales bacterium]|nr:serine hydrolase [Elusimicrobiales bacterium]
MKKIILIFMTMVIGISVYAQQQANKTVNPYKKLMVTAWKLSSRISENPIKLNYVFDKSFFTAISEDEIVKILKELYKQNGSVVSITTVTYRSELSGDFLFHTDKEYAIPVSITINKNGKVTSLFFKPSFGKTLSFNDITKKFESLPYESKAMLVERYDNITDKMYSLNEDMPIAVGSSFKLYILAYIIENKLSWSKVINILPSDRSLPSGRMQLYPDNAPVTLFSLTEAMISQSDNTATDTLIRFIGREKLEKFINSFSEKKDLNVPLLKTSELFKIKSSTDVAEEYIRLDIKGKRKMLDEIKNKEINIDSIDFSKPYLVNSLEWFFSPKDMCNIMSYFKGKNDPYANTILSMNTGLDTKTAGYVWAGYKGGSESGVLSTTWFLKANDDRYYCITASVNDSDKNIDEKEYFSIMQDIINIANKE